MEARHSVQVQSFRDGNKTFQGAQPTLVDLPKKSEYQNDLKESSFSKFSLIKLFFSIFRF